MKEFNARNWYWTVAKDGSRVFSSTTRDYVPTSDQTFVKWLEDGTKPTPIGTEEDLGGVLAPYLIEPIPPGIYAGYQAALIAYADGQPIWNAVMELDSRVSALEGVMPSTLAALVARALKRRTA